MSHWGEVVQLAGKHRQPVVVGSFLVANTTQTDSYQIFNFAYLRHLLTEVPWKGPLRRLDELYRYTAIYGAASNRASMFSIDQALQRMYVPLREQCRKFDAYGHAPIPYDVVPQLLLPPERNTPTTTLRRDVATLVQTLFATPARRWHEMQPQIGGTAKPTREVLVRVLDLYRAHDTSIKASASAATAKGDGWTSSDTSLRAELDLLQLSEGHIPVPPELTSTVIEIGANGHGLAWDSPFPVHNIKGIAQGTPLSKQPHVLLVSFEPLLDKWASYLSIATSALHAEHQQKKWSKDDWRHFESATWRTIETPSLGWSVSGRALVLPFAVGQPEGTATFHVAKSDGCSSMRAIEPDADARVWQKGADWMKRFMRDACGQGAATRRVPVVALQTVLEKWLPGRTIDFLKVDAQGYDLQVILSAKPEALARVRALEVEVTSPDVKLPYKGADACVDTLGNLTALGFHPVVTQTGKPRSNLCLNKGLHGAVTFVRTSQ